MIPTADTAVPVDVVINEVLAEPDVAAGDAGCDGVVSPSADSFVEVVNRGPAVDLSGWALSDALLPRHVFPAGTVLGSGEAVLVFGGLAPALNGGPWAWCGPLPPGVEFQVASSGGLQLDASGDSVRLLDLGANLVDDVAWTADVGARSLVRGPAHDPGSPLLPHDCVVGALFPWSAGTRSDDFELADPDLDGIPTGVEIAIGTDPGNPDSDADGLSDGAEVVGGTSPTAADSDADGLADGWELQLGTDPLLADTDGDGLSDGDEVIDWQTDVLRADTDGDGLLDGDEVAMGTSPLLTDTDGDGLPDDDELERGTDPAHSDTDGGGTSDGAELGDGTDPLDPADDVQPPPPPSVDTGVVPPPDPVDERIVAIGGGGCDSGRATPGPTALLWLAVLAAVSRRRRSGPGVAIPY